MNTENTYNGWSNYETWCAALWLDNDEASAAKTQAMVNEARECAVACDTFTFEESCRIELARLLEEAFDAFNPLADSASFFSDMLNAAIGRVDFQEIAEHLLEE